MFKENNTNKWLVSIFLILSSCSGTDTTEAPCDSASRACACSPTLQGRQICTNGDWSNCECPDSGVDSGLDVDAGPCACGPLETCFEGKFCVAKMVQIENLYGIDQTEVTRSQYEAWLKTEPSTEDQPACTFLNTSFQPEESCMKDKLVCQTDCSQQPQVCVDWCDAFAYCKAVGKRLCGAIAGGATPYESFDSPAESQWHRACSSGGLHVYPYGDTYEPLTCAGNDKPVSYKHGSTEAVGSLPGCVSHEPGFEGVYDLSGSVGEWEDSCSEPNTDYCRVRGGSFTGQAKSLLCSSESVWPGRALTEISIGIRCCSL